MRRKKKMNGKVILGILIFLLLASSPFWLNMSGGDAHNVPDLVYPEGEEFCIKDKDYMRAYHMDMLDEWRDLVVRGNARFIEVNGKKYEMSLSKTCMDCHSNKADFCDQCHDYLEVHPYCWECHVEPGEVKP